MDLDYQKSLKARQRRTEDLARSRGRKTFEKRVRRAKEAGHQTVVGAARRLLQEATWPLAEYLEEWVRQSARTPGRKHSALKWVKQVGIEEAAFVTSRVLLDKLETRRPVKKVAHTISSTIMRELRCRRMEELASGLFKYKIRSFQTSSYAHMARSMDAAIRHGSCDECYENEVEDCNHLDMEDLNLSYSQHLLVGYKLIDAFIQATGMVEREDATEVDIASGSPRNRTYLTSVDDVSEWLEARNTILGSLYPVPLPMVVPPLPWGKDKDGGYWYGLKGEFEFVRGSASHQRWVNTSATPKVEAAVNRIQETPWRINTPVLEVLEEIARRGGGMAGVPELEAREMPPKPPDIDTNEEARNEWREAAGKLKDKNSQILGMARPVFDALWVSSELKDQEAIWFPHSLDFRGRIYPIPSILSPQGPDFHKGLLQFADGAPVGDRGAWWLAIYGANCLGEWESRKTGAMQLDDRVELIDHLSEAIKEVASDPWADTWWMDADEPIQFLAFCFDWAGYVEQGSEYVSYLPVSMDGSNNGLQHLSAMLRDPVGAEAVNVRANREPRDVYLEVATQVLDRLEEEAPTKELALQWLRSGLVDRKLCKRPVMTYSYGSKLYGFTNQIYEELKGRMEWPEIEEQFTDVDLDTGEIKKNTHAAFTFLATRIWDALQDTVVAAAEAMEWMQGASRVVSKSGNAIRWVTPGTDFPVIQDSWRYYRQEQKRIKTILAGRIVKPSYYETTDQLDSRKQANAVSPNFVHSLDAAVLMLTVLQADEDGIECFAMVHDSYGTLAADAEILNRATREVFYSFYLENDALEQLYFQVLDQVDDPVEVEEPPGMGALDISEVLMSDYFFA